MIRVECPGCGTRLRGPDNAAGKSIKCPKCGHSIPVPKPIPEPDRLLEDDQAPGDAYGFDEPLPPRAGSSAQEGAGEDFGPKPAKVKKAKKKGEKKRSSEDDDLSTTDMVLCLLCPGIACIASIVYMIQGKGKGLKVFGLSILGNILWGIIRLAIQSSMNQPGVGP
jgi:hypothetical protein